MLDQRPERRHRNMEQVVVALETCRAAVGPTIGLGRPNAELKGWLAGFRRLPRRKKLPILLGGVASAVLLVLLLVGVAATRMWDPMARTFDPAPGATATPRPSRQPGLSDISAVRSPRIWPWSLTSRQSGFSSMGS